jgi:hypothetical protein
MLVCRHIKMKLILRNRFTLVSSTKQEKRGCYTSLGASAIIIAWQLLHPLYTKLAKDKSAQTVLKQRGGPRGIKEKN